MCVCASWEGCAVPSLGNEEGSVGGAHQSVSWGWCLWPPGNLGLSSSREPPGLVEEAVGHLPRSQTVETGFWGCLEGLCLLTLSPSLHSRGDPICRRPLPHETPAGEGLSCLPAQGLLPDQDLPPKCGRQR